MDRPCVDLVRTTSCAPTRAWAAVTDVTHHERHVPLTRVSTDPPPVRPGWGFAARTGVGPVGFVDSMVVVVWDPPSDDADSGRFRAVKTGRVLDGWAEFTVAPSGTGGSVVRWQEDVTVRLLGPLSGPLERRLAPPLFGGLIDALLADAEAADERTTRGGPAR